MLRKRYRALILLGTIPAIAACTQATRHSNTMIFGTNTTLGLKVGQDVNQTPQVLVAYDRQEAVIMPLLANTAEKPNTQNMLSPCPAQPYPTPTPSPPATGSDLKAAMDPCKFVASQTKGGNLVSQDSYSVLASFGAQIEGNAAENKGAVGLAQYFATGVAAQLLASNGGAAVVSVGTGAEKSAKSTASGAASAAVTGKEAAGAALAKGPIEEAIALNKKIDEPWKCGDPSTERSKYDEIITAAKVAVPGTGWTRIENAGSIGQARFVLRTARSDIKRGFLASQEANCGG